MYQKTFLLGVGAQKSGTTWLHRYLIEDRSFALPAMKEYHVWDAIARVDGFAELTSKFSGPKQALRDAMIADPDRYFGHFAGLLEQDGKMLTGDITPAYAALPPKQFGRILSGFERRGVRVRVVFLMRDPVERCWSAVRMYARRGTPVAGMNWNGDLEQSLLRYCATEHAQARGRYDRTVANLKRVFDETALYFGFYENLFDEASIKSLSAFLDVDPRVEFAESRFNEAAGEARMSDTTRERVAEKVRTVLEFCSSSFPETKTLWRSYP